MMGQDVKSLHCIPVILVNDFILLCLTKVMEEICGSIEQIELFVFAVETVFQFFCLVLNLF